MDIEVITNDRKKLIAGVSALALLAAVGGIIIGRSTASSQPEQATPAGKETSEEQVASRPGFVPMTAAQLQASGIQSLAIEPGSIASEILAQATVAAPPEGKALVTARADGAVVQINRRLGDPVGAGETVALLESREAAAFVAERNAAAARAQAARSAAARERRLYEAKITARQDLEAADANRAEAEAQLQRAQAAVQAAGVTANGRYLAVRSPISGRISEVDTQLGAYVMAGAELFNVADPRRVQINAAVSAADAQRIRPGDPARIEMPDGSTLGAVVRSSTATLNLESRAATVVLQPAGVPAGLAQGQAVRVRIIPRGSASNGIVVPEEAVQQVEGRDVVFIRQRGGFQAVPVTVGQRSNGRVEITSGLQSGQVVAARNAFTLKAELSKGSGEEE